MTLKSSTAPLSQAYDAAIYDLDGVCYRGQEPIEYAGESITAAVSEGQKAVYLTNNAARTPASIGEHLRSLNIPANDSEVYTAAMAGAELAAGEIPAGSKVFVIGGEGLVWALTQKGCSPSLTPRTMIRPPLSRAFTRRLVGRSCPRVR